MKKIIICIILFVGLILTTLIIFDDKDACLDSGICKYGTTLKIEGKEIIVNKDTCINNNGKWYEKQNKCIFH